MTETSSLRSIRLVGPRLPSATPAEFGWNAGLGVVYSGASGAARSLLSATFGLRVLLQDGDATDIRIDIPATVKRPLSAERRTVAMQTPHLLAANAYPHDGASLGLGGFGQRYDLVPDRRTTDGVTTLLVTPLDPWPTPQRTREIEVPRFALAANRLSVLVSAKGGTAKKPAGFLRLVPIAERGVVAAFVGAAASGTRPASVELPLVTIEGDKDGPYVALELAPNGIEFRGTIANPARTFRSEAAERIAVVLRLACAADALSPANPEWALVLVREETERRDQIRAMLAGVRGALGPAAGNPLVLDIDTAATVAAVRWPLVKAADSLALPATDDWIVRVEPAAVRAMLMGSPIRQGTLTTQAAIAADRLEIAGKGDTGRLTLVADRRAGPAAATAPAGPRVTLRRHDKGVAIAIAATAADGTLAWSLDALSFARDLVARYAKAGVHPAGATETFAFLPIVGGWLQLPLPLAPPSAPATPAKPAPPPPAGPAPFATEVEFAISEREADAVCAGRRLSLSGADRIAATAAFRRASAGTPTVELLEIELAGAGGTVEGVLWAASGSPSAEAILPSVATGPAAIVAPALAFGIPPRPGALAFSSKGFTPGEPFALTVLAGSDASLAQVWHGYDDLPLVTAIAMTRTAEGSGLPSQTRGLLCRSLALDAIKLAYPAAHGVPSLSLPAKSLEELPLAGGKDSPFAQVPLVPVTLPGIEFKAAASAFAGLATRLRFDLPVLDELFATTRLPEKAPSVRTGPPPAPADAPTALDLPRLYEAWRKAVDRLDLSRVLDSRAFEFGLQTRDAEIETLARGVTWKTRFSLELNVEVGGIRRRLGAYTLGEERASGEAALAGLTHKFTGAEVNDAQPGPIEVVGFAAAFRQQTIEGVEMWRDTRAAFAESRPRIARFATGKGGLVFRETALWREAGRPIERLWHGTLLQPIPIASGAVAAGRTLGLWFRDLPLVRNAGGRGLLAVTDGPELALGPRQSAFDTNTLPHSVHEWRFCNDPVQPGNGAPSAYEIMIGPFAFRPLRLLALRLDGEDAALTPAAATILGTISLRDGGGDAGRGPFGADRAYATGNLVALTLPAQGDGLSLATANWAAGRVAEDEGQPAVSAGGLATLSFRIGDARILLGSAPDQSGTGEVALSLTLAVGAAAAIDGLPSLTSATLDTHLFGSRVTLQGGKPILFRDRIEAVFALQTPGKAVACGIAVDAITVTIAFVNGARQTSVRLNGRLSITAADEGAAPADAREIIAHEFGQPLWWLNQPVATAAVAIDHERGVARWSADIDGAVAIEPIAGLSMPTPSPAAMSLTLAFPRSAPQRSLPLQFTSGSGFGGFVVASKDGSLRRFDHAIVGGAPLWFSRIEVDLQLDAQPSRIRWPVESIDDSLITSRPVSGGAVPAALRPFDPATALEHQVALRIGAQPIATSLLGVRKGPTQRVGFARPWLFHALADHRVSAPAPAGAEPSALPSALRWTSLDHVSVVAADSLGADLDDSARIYAFAPRFRQLDSAEETAAAAKGGIVLRRFARAGLPPEQAVWNGATDAPASFASLAGALIVTGAGPSIVETGMVDGDQVGVPLALPWIITLDPGPADPIDTFRQAPDSARAEWEAPDIDWASGRPMPLARGPIAAQAIGSGQAAEIADALRQATASAAGDPAVRALTTVEQAFLRPSKPVSVAERPVWLRSLLALRTVWRAFGQQSQSLDDKVTMIVPSGRSDGRFAALRLGSRRLPVDGMPIAWAGALVAIGSSGTRIDPPAGGRTVAGRARLIARADQLVKDSVALLEIAVDGNGVAAAIWRRIDPPQDSEDVVLDIPIEQPLGGRLYASSALGWPTADGTKQAATGALGIGDDAPFQDDGKPLQDRQTEEGADKGAGRFGSGLSGRSASLSLPARSLGGDGAAQAIFVALGRKMLFERPKDTALPLVAPPARYLSAGEARVVLPRTAALDETLKTVVKGKAAPIVPPRLERISFGLRPGTLQAEFDMLLFGAGSDGKAQALDPDAAEYGRPGHAGPRVLRQIRAPRAPVLPRILIESGAPNLVRTHGRRTFVEIDDHDPANGEPTPFRLFGGAATVLRSNEQSLWVGIADPLPSDWDGRLTLRISAPGQAPLPAGATTDPLRDRLVAAGLLSTELSAALSIDHVAAPFATARWRRVDAAIELVLICVAPDPDALRDALDTADGDTIATLILRCGPVGRADAPPPEFELAPAATDKLRPADQTMLSIRLPIRPSSRASLRIGAATLAFADPSYDRALAGPGASDSRRAADGSLWKLALDRFEYGSDTPVQFAFGMIDSETGYFARGASNVPVEIVRQASDARQNSNAMRPLLLGSTAPTATQATPYAFTLDQLRYGEGTDPPPGPIRFADGDQLIVSVEIPLSAGPSLRLSVRVNIVNAPVIAPSPAAYALVAFAPGKARVPLHATAPVPQRIECDDLLKDLARGHVRRHAVFLWPLPLTPDVEISDVALVKIDRAGGGQLPDRRTDFQSVTII